MRKYYTDETIIETLKDIKRGKSLSKVSKTFGVSIGIISGWCKKAGIPILGKHHDWKKIKEEIADDNVTPLS